MKTSVEWLVQEINKLTGLNVAIDEPVIEQAKEMEKQQIIEANLDAQKKFNSQDFKSMFKVNSYKYYNETFNK